MDYKYVFINSDTGEMKVYNDDVCNVNTGWIYKVPKSMRLDVSLYMFDKVVYLFQLVMNHPEAVLIATKSDT